MQNGDWLTNAPQAAKRLREIDRAYAKDREAARDLLLAQKIVALREAREKQVAARRAYIATL